MSTERSRQDGKPDDVSPKGDSAGTYFISVEDFEARKPPRERETHGKAENGSQ